MFAKAIVARPVVLAGKAHLPQARVPSFFPGQPRRVNNQRPSFRTFFRKDGTDPDANKQQGVEAREKVAGVSGGEQAGAPGSEAKPDSSQLVRMAYGTLALATTVASVSALVFPEQLSKLILNYAPSAMATTLLRLTGASLFLDVATKVTLMEQQPVDRKDESARQAASHLNWALLVQSAGVLVLLMQATSVRNPALLGTVGTLVAATAALAGSQIFALRAPEGSPPASRRLTGRILSFFVPETLPAFVYSAVTGVVALVGARLLFSWPGAVQAPFSAVLDPIMTLCSRAIGWGLVLAAMVALVLRDVSDKPRPGQAPLLPGDAFRMLNLGLAATMLVSAGLLGLGVNSGVLVTDKIFWSVTGALGAVGAWAGYQSAVGGSSADASSA